MGPASAATGGSRFLHASVTELTLVRAGSAQTLPTRSTRSFEDHLLKGEESDMPEKSSKPPGRFARLLRRRGVVASVVVAVAAIAAGPVASARSTAGPKAVAASADTLGVKPGKIKHVWLIILENK